ncbi:MAG TPA: CheR family methyltransferase, partial [Saprospiraceae bacterium]|nr:CheR family methyltransferase [Saprospiraceae bacterium]
GNFQVNKELRDMCVFAHHNFLKDPPFGKMDFISCRNVLIYMEPYLQKKALTTFHYALNPKGFLLLGKSETTSSVSDLFSSAAKNDKLFIRKDVPGRFMHVASQRSEQNFSISDNNPKSENIRTDFQKTADEIMLSKYTPAGVIINEQMDIVHFRGNTGKFLEQSPGKPSHNLLKMAKQGLAFELRNILHKAKKEKGTVIKENIVVQENAEQHYISVEAVPLPNTIEPFYLILFHENNSGLYNSSVIGRKKSDTAKTKVTQKDLRILQLENELSQTREDMRSITEDQEAANEELQSANEELLSGSEELQSLNEELETNKEELQSTNEELTIVNHEMINLNEQVTEARDYAEAIVATIHEPLLVLDKNLKIRTANSSYYKSFRLNELETEGKLIFEVNNKQWDIPVLRKMLEKILPEKSSFIDLEITHNFSNIGERVMVLNARELKVERGSEKLILLAMEDITEVRKKTVELQLKEKELLNKDINERKLEKAKLEKAVEERTKDLEKVNKELAFQNEEKEKRSKELILANKELAYQNKEKEKRASELILANKELAFQNEEKEKRAKELILANKELQSFAYVSSHDLQEPLRKIQTFAGRILEKETQNLTDSGKDYVTKMQLAANRMQKLIEDLLAFSRLNLAERKFESYDLNKLIEEVKTELKEVMEVNKATIKVEEMSSANIIPFQFRQLMHNLISNAFKFSKPGIAPRILIKSEIVKGSDIVKKNVAIPSEMVTTERDYCHISIKDNGIGFESNYSKRIFEVFQKLHPKEEYAGTGIGLAIVKKIVEIHNGMITATSELGKGVVFDIYLPA